MPIPHVRSYSARLRSAACAITEEKRNKFRLIIRSSGQDGDGSHAWRLMLHAIAHQDVDLVANRSLHATHAMLSSP
jgi:hypothetical protein